MRPRSDAPREYDVLCRGLDSVLLPKLRAWGLDRFYAQLLAAGGQVGRPLSAGSVRKVHTMLRLALDQAVRWQWLAENPAVHASPPTASPLDTATSHSGRSTDAHQDRGGGGSGVGRLPTIGIRPGSATR